MRGILGSGFGIYGYLPAMLRQWSGPVTLTSSSRVRLLERPELNWTLPRVKWVDDRHDLINQTRLVAIALPPAVQEEVVAELLTSKKTEAVVLEKPIARRPGDARDMLIALREKGIRVRVGYTFCYTHWFGRLTSCPDIYCSDLLEIEWFFMAHHFTRSLKNWKTDHDLGGGVLRFYTIQMIALIERLGFRNMENIRVSKQDGVLARIEGAASDASRPTLRFVIDSHCKFPGFRIFSTKGNVKKTLLDLRDPFGEEVSPGSEDGRISPLRRILESLREDDAEILSAYLRIIDLWDQAESEILA